MTSDAPLRLAIVAPYDLSSPGGINNQIRAQADALRRLGHHVRIYGPASSALVDDEQSLGGVVGVSFGGTESGLGVDLRAISAVARLSREPFDVVHVHEPLTPLTPWIVLLRSRAPLVGTFHVHRERGHAFYATFAPLLRPLARRLRARIAVSKAAQNTVAAHIPGDYEIVPNAIDVERFRRPRPRPAAFAHGRRHVVYVGRLEPRKGVDVLIRAMAEVTRGAPDVTLVIAGDGPLRADLEALAAQVGVAAIFAGRVADDELPAYFQSADIVCSPARGGESFGIVLLEAMACAKPVVASRIAGYEALVGPLECARLAAPGDSDAFAREISWLLESDDRRQTLGQRGAAAAREFDAEAIGRRLTGIYRSVMPS
jgi:phosphatidyl-myo-inositol alpha-mannosyltransferase